MPRKIAIQGFTLIELMITISLLGILAAIALPSFQDMIVQSRLRSQTNELIGAVQYARAEAIKRNQTISLCATASATSTSCAAGNWGNWVVLDSGDNAIRRGGIPATLKLTSTLQDNTLRFLPTGLNNISAGNDSLNLCSPTGSGNTARSIQIGSSGRTTITPSSGCP